MRYNQLGRTGLYVSELCLGTMTFGGEGKGLWEAIGTLEQDAVDAIVRRALDAGINFIDTANVYADGNSEVITGQALKNLKVPRENVVVATKVLGETGTKGPNSRGLSRYHIIEACKASLKRLQLDHIDLYQVHGFDPATPVEETLDALDTLVRHGHVRYIGVSNWAAWQIAKALGTSERLGLARFQSLQAYYTIAGRDLERELVPMMRSEGVGLMVWSPLGWGRLTGKIRRGQAASGGRLATAGGAEGGPTVSDDYLYGVVDALDAVAAETGKTVPQVALNWLLTRPTVCNIVIGARNEEQLKQNLGAVGWSLSQDQIARLDAASREHPIYPYWHQTGFDERNPKPTAW